MTQAAVEWPHDISEDRSKGLVLDDLVITRVRDGATLVRLTAQVPPGQVLTIMGPSGSGKSTLLLALIGALDPAFRATGRILLNGRDVTRVPTPARRIGILFQDPLLFPHLSVAGNLGFGLPPAPRSALPDRRARIDTVLAQAGLEGFGPRDPSTLSGGEAARVALLRTLLAEPEALLLDEPFARLDQDRRASIRRFVLDRARAQGLPVVLVTHDPADAEAAGGAVLAPDGSTVSR